MSVYIQTALWKRHVDVVRRSALYKEKNPSSACWYPQLGLMSEIGELADMLKCALREGQPISSLDSTKVLKEIGDVCWYFTALQLDRLNAFGDGESQSYDDYYDGLATIEPSSDIRELGEDTSLDVDPLIDYFSRDRDSVDLVIAIHTLILEADVAEAHDFFGRISILVESFNRLGLGDQDYSVNDVVRMNCEKIEARIAANTLHNKAARKEE